jgi:hypothetical protein
VIGREEFERLIDSMANRNPTPVFVHAYSWYAAAPNPWFPDNYDFDEDDRVRGVIGQLCRYRNEDVWRWLTEHRHDDRYSLAYAFDDGAFISSIGIFCRRAVIETLQHPYLRHLPPSLYGSRPNLRPLAALGEQDAWFRDHPDLPLYLQQIHFCEAAIEKIPGLARGTDVEKRQFAVDIRNEIDGLKRSKRPMLDGFCMIYSGTDRYNAKRAKEIKRHYSETHLPVRMQMATTPDE